MINISELVQGAGWKNFMKYLYGWGATLVIVGALFKLQHWKGAGTMLTIGMTVEAFIFFFSAFEPIHEEVDWTLVYPELAGMHDDEELSAYRSKAGGGGISKEDLAELMQAFAGSNGGGKYSRYRDDDWDDDDDEPKKSKETVAPAQVAASGSNAGLVFSQKFDEMLESAEIGPELFAKVSKGLQNLSNSAAEITSISSAAEASENLANTFNSVNDQMREETNLLSSNYGGLKESVNILSESYQRAANHMEDSGTGFVEQIQKTGDEFKEMILSSGQNVVNDVNGSASGLMETYNDLATKMNTDLEGMSMNNKTYQEQLGILNKNIEALNAVHEMNLQMVNGQMDESKEIYSGMSELTTNLKDSIESTREYKAQVDHLNKNLETLNEVYGNMLSALDVVK